MKRKKSILLLGAFILAALLLFAGCGSGKSSTGDGQASNSLTLEGGKLKVGMEVGYPPMEYLDEDGVTEVGFDVEVAKEISKRLDLDLEIVDTAWDGIFSSLDSNRYDCIISSVSITKERSEKYNLTEPYIANKLVIVTAKDKGISSPEDLAGLKVATQTETTADIYMRDLIADGLELGDYYVYDKIIQCFDELKIGRVDAVMVDSVVAAYYIGEDSDEYSIVWENDEAEPMGICLKKGNDQLTEKIEGIIDDMYEDGTMKTISEKYFGAGNSVGVR